MAYSTRSCVNSELKKKKKKLQRIKPKKKKRAHQMFFPLPSE